MIEAFESLPGWIWHGMVSVWHAHPGLCIVFGVVAASFIYLGALELALALQEAKDVRNRR